MQKTEIVRTEADINRVIEIIKGIPLDPVHKIEIREYKRNISAEQRGLYWKWMTVIGADLGRNKDEMHCELKGIHLVPIFERDDEDYRNMIESVIHVRKLGMKKEADFLKKEIIKLTSITDADTKQMSEYMNEVDGWARDRGIFLPVPIPEDYGL